ncbi:helix-turn-helix transcriptional regulator [Streptomyces sp. YS415]|uniref:ArsR/SmtB family transcription factor n=1 Tax=Streptomyces sp. YS415 TaxID=2944806 RepID=UPI00202231D5|nr:helix-turn-helix domain-containing protein [Streptomyces sp. YS415]MCL7427161.1 helix-turn-helix domain-containing protein [Streptomyces sp. YS415]
MTGSRLLLGPLDEVHVEVARTPGATLFPVLHEVLGGARHGVPGRWRSTVASALPASADVIRPLFGPGHGWLPDVLALTGDVRATRMGTVLSQLREADPDDLAAEVRGQFGDAVPASWQRVLDDPARFLAAYHEVADAVWRRLEPLWARTDALLGKETERVGSAVVSRNLGAVLTALSPRVRYVDGALELPQCTTEVFELAGRRLVLVPVVSATAVSMHSLDRDDVVWFSYPLPGLRRLDPSQHQPTREDGLTQLLGPVRAGVLRSVQPPATVSELARTLNTGVSTITYHCEYLKAAGLLQRERYGREVRQRLTGRGAELVELLTGPPR